MAKKIDISKKKKELLDKLKSPSNPDGYKRYVGTPLRYAGGKTLAVGHIVNLLPDKIGKLVSPFLGGASVEIAIAKELGVEVIGYDIFDILINYWHYQTTEPEKLAKKLSKFKPTKEEEAIIERHLGANIPTPEEMIEIELSSRLYKDNEILYMTTSMIAQSESANIKFDSVSFLLTQQKLITIRYIEPQSFRVFSAKLHTLEIPEITPVSIFIELFIATP
jgi:site-specific DNA-adenine methylase